MPDILKSAQTQIDDLDLPFSSRGHDLPQEPEPIPIIPPPVAKKHSNKSLVLAVILFLVATLPLAVYFISQQRQLADNRGKAQDGAYACTDTCVPARVECSDGGGVIVAGTCSSGRFCCNFGGSNRGCTPAGVSLNDTGGRPCCDGTTLQNGVCTTTTTTSGTTTCTCDYCTLAGSTGPGTCTNGIKQTARPGCAASASQCSGTTTLTGGTPITTLAPGTSQCQNGDQNRDQGTWLICECANGCSYKTDTTEGSGGSGWVCDQNCHTVPAGTRPSGACTQIDWVHSGSSNYCGVAEINCPASCQTGGTTAPPGGNPPPGGTQPPGPTATPTPTPTPVPGGTCELIKVYDAAGTEITQAVKDGTKKLALGEQITIATSKGNATKARFRIQGIADWAENDPAKTTATEYRLGLTIPSTLTQAQGTFEVEVFVNSVWK